MTRMTHTLSFFIVAFTVLLSRVQTGHIDCDYQWTNWHVINSVYICDVQNEPRIISKETAIIYEAYGNQEKGMSKYDVTGFKFYHKGTLLYLPRGLGELFPNLKGIWIERGGMQEIHQSDLKQFPYLRNLGIYGMEIKTIENGLFNYNPHLEFIGLSGNRIKNIAPDVFNHLSLTYLWLSNNICVNKDANTVSEVRDVIKQLRATC